MIFWAHGIGGARDLPISVGLAVTGAVVALLVSFAVLALAWRRPRYDAATSGREVPWLDAVVHSTSWVVLWRVIGMLAFLYTAFVAFFGQDTTNNPVFGIFFVLLWVGIVPLSFVVGPAFKALSPVRTINLAVSALARSDPEEGVYAYPERLGMWPGAVGLFAFVWFELVYPSSAELGPVRFWCALYVGIMLVGGALYGNRFYAACDPFEVYSSLVARLSPWGERDGHLVVRSPLANLDALPVRPGLLAVIVVLFGSTGFDSFKDSSRWIGFVQNSDVNGRLLNNVALVVFILLAGAVFSVACMLTAVQTPPGSSRLRVRLALPAAFAHSIVPIVLGYIVAHYLSFAFEIGSKTVIQISDPLSNGSNIFGTADWGYIVWWSYHPQLLAVTKVLAVVLGHIVAAVAAHDRAVRILPPRHQIVGQLPLLAAMVAFTCTGLYLLFAA